MAGGRWAATADPVALLRQQIGPALLLAGCWKIAANLLASGAATDNGIGLEPASPSVLLRDNIGATSAVCDAAVRGGAVRFVFSSSAFAVGWSHAAAGEAAWARSGVARGRV